MRVIHTLIDERGHFSKEELLAAGRGLFKLNVRTHGDYEDILMLVHGRFLESSGMFYFQYDSPEGSKSMLIDKENMPWVHSVEKKVEEAG